MTFEHWHLDDYEKSCLYGTAKMRERLVKEGKLLPRPDDPEEVRWHEEWKAGKAPKVVP